MTINSKDNPEFWTLCRPGYCGCMYGDCERIRQSGNTSGYFEHVDGGAYGINDIGPNVTPIGLSSDATENAQRSPTT